MATALVGLGSNLGDRACTLHQAIAALEALPDTHVAASSRLYATAPVGGPSGQPDFLNAAARLETSLAPHDLLLRMQQIEHHLGRVRGERWSARSLDLDLLLYNDAVIETPNLTVPHSRMAFRRFVLAPAAEIAAEMVHPTSGWTIGQLLAHLNSAADYIAIAAPIGAGKSRLAAAVQARTPSRLICEPLDEPRLAAFYDQPDREAWQMETWLMNQRAELLVAAGLSVQSSSSTTDSFVAPAAWTLSDFWFEQSRAFASVWLPPERHQAFQREFDAVQTRIAPPKLIVWLDAPLEWLIANIRNRGRPYEQALTCDRSNTSSTRQRVHPPDNMHSLARRACSDRLGALRDALSRLVREPGHGPVLALDAAQPPLAVDEVTAAMAAMKLEPRPQ